MLDGRQLRQKFADFNEAYFGNRLPSYEIRVKPHIIGLHQSGRTTKKRRLIEVRQGQPDREAIGTLLHEMVHAATSERHGMPWKREMIRLRKAGAPLAEADMMISLDDWDGMVTKQQTGPLSNTGFFQDEANEVLPLLKEIDALVVKVLQRHVDVRCPTAPWVWVSESKRRK